MPPAGDEHAKPYYIKTMNNIITLSTDRPTWHSSLGGHTSRINPTLCLRYTPYIGRLTVYIDPMQKDLLPPFSLPLPPSLLIIGQEKMSGQSVSYLPAEKLRGQSVSYLPEEKMRGRGVSYLPQEKMRGQGVSYLPQEK